MMFACSGNNWYKCILVYLTLSVTSLLAKPMWRCQGYNGTQCVKGTSYNMASKYFIPVGKTVEIIDSEIEELKRHDFKGLNACKQYLQFLLCEYKFRSCPQQKPCHEVCKEVRSSVCFKDLDKNSKLYHWLHYEFECDAPDARNCNPYSNDFTNVGIVETSCKNEAILSENSKYEQIPLIHPNSLPTLNRNELLQQFHSVLTDDLQCYRGNWKIEDFVSAQNIVPPKFLEVQNIEKTEIDWYCRSKNKSILPLGNVRGKIKLAVSYFENVAAFILTDHVTNKTKVVFSGTDHICLDKGGFSYQIADDDSYGYYYHGKSVNNFIVQWIDQAESNVELQNVDYYSPLMHMFGSGGLNINKLQFSIGSTQSILWVNGEKYRLFEDNNSSLNSRALDINFTNIQSKLLIAGTDSVTNRNKSQLIYIKSPVNPKQNLVTILNIVGIPSEDSYTPPLLKNLIQRLSNHMQTLEVEYFLRMNNSNLVLPDWKYFLGMKNIQQQFDKNLFDIRVQGRIKTISHDSPTWLDEDTFQMELTSSQNSFDQFIIDVKFKNNFSEQDCQRKMSKSWEDFNKYLSIIKKYGASMNENFSIRKRTENITCSVCCNHNVYSLARVQIKSKKNMDFDIKLDIVKGNKKWIVEIFNLEGTLLTMKESLTPEEFLPISTFS